MEFYQVEQIDSWYFKICLPLSDRRRCTFNRNALKYIFAIRRYVNTTEVDYLFDSYDENTREFIFQVGFAEFVLNEFNNELDKESKVILSNLVYNYDPEIFWPGKDNLREHQNLDVQLLLERRRGLFQTYTSYGKSEVIATLSWYLSTELNKKVLIVTASNASLDEIYLRIKKRFGRELDYIDYDSNLNAINLNGFLKSSEYDPSNEYWKSEFIILADEVEYCVSDSAIEFYEKLPNVKYMYGFSATPDKSLASPIYSRIPDEDLERLTEKYLLSDTPNSNEYRRVYDEMTSEIHDVLGRNKYLIGYYGATVIFRQPTDFEIQLIDVMSTITADDIEIPQDYNYNEIIYNLFVDERMCHLIEGISYHVEMLFIPMFRLEVIDYWVEHYFQKKDFIVSVISSRGYELYEQGKLLGAVSLEEFKRLVSAGIIGVILGTKSSYNSMDLPELKRSLLLYSKAANIVIQAIGRTARGGKFEVYNIDTIKSIPTYTKDLKKRKELIENYYEFCNIKNIKRNENLYL